MRAVSLQGHRADAAARSELPFTSPIRTLALHLGRSLTGLLAFELRLCGGDVGGIPVRLTVTGSSCGLDLRGAAELLFDAGRRVVEAASAFALLT